MDTATINVRIGGSFDHVVPKTGVTPMEVALLRHIHQSEQAVEIVSLDEPSTVHPLTELRRLEKVYPIKFSEEAFPGAKNMPGILPTTFAQIGLAIPVNEAPDIVEDDIPAEPPVEAKEDAPVEEKKVSAKGRRKTRQAELVEV